VIRPRHLIIAALLTIGVAAAASAEPMFLAKQYTRCATCHYSPSGGGLLTPYGRSLSGLELSMTRRTRQPSEPETNASAEEAFLFGLLGDALRPLNLGVELRPSHLQYSAAGFSDSRNLWMTADLVAALRIGKWTAYGEIGRQPTTPEATIGSSEYWLRYEAANGFSVRAGRFLPAFGIRYADHTSMARSLLGFDQYDQVFGLEVSKATDRWLTEISIGPGYADAIIDNDGRQAFTASARVQHELTPKMVVAGSGIYRAKSDVEDESGAFGGAFGYAPWPRLSIWTEGSAHTTTNGTAMVFVNETSFEAVRGLWFKVSPQARSGYGDGPGVIKWSASVVALPRTHWNANLTFYNERVRGSSTALKTVLLQLFVYL
jgi:hypothetical protein